MPLHRADVEAMADADALAALGLSFESIDDFACALLGYQRTKQISRKARLSWEAGQTDVLLSEVQAKRGSIVSGAALEVYQEYLPLRDALRGREIGTVCDIGCGQGLNDLFLERDFGPHFTLVDIEETDEQYHLWAEEGAGYASLGATRALLTENGVDPGRIETINPRKADWDQRAGRFDLVTSLFSCGFHYPVDGYIDVFLTTIAGGGAVCLDLRKHYYRKGSVALSQLWEAGAPALVFDDTKSSRFLFRKP